MANATTMSLLVCIVVMAFIVEIKALDCDDAGDMIFLCLSGNKKRTADSGLAVQGTRSAGQDLSRQRHVSINAQRKEQDHRELSEVDEALKSRLFEIASRLLEHDRAESRAHSDYEVANQRDVEQADNKKEFSESAMFDNRDVKNVEMADERRNMELDNDIREVDSAEALESVRKQLLSRWMNERRVHNE